MEHPLITTARAIDKAAETPVYVNKTNYDTKGLAQELTERILNESPNLFREVEYLMQGPTDLVKGKAICAHAHELGVMFSPLLVPVDEDMTSEKAEEAVLNLLTQALVKAILEIKERVEVNGNIMCPYQLVYPRLNGQLVTTAKFTIRYGIYNPKDELEY